MMRTFTGMDWLGLVLASLMFGVALELRLSHFSYVLRRPLPVACKAACPASRSMP